jgi:AcrR family transcriptional regulator
MNQTDRAQLDDDTAQSDARSSRQEARREQLLRAATEVFFRSGFAGASVDEIIAQVGGSKRTIYSYFGNKEQLFSTIVQEISRRAMGPLAEEDICRADLETTLYDVGRRYLAVVMSPEALQLYRTDVAEGSRFPQLARVFFDTGPGRAVPGLAPGSAADELPGFMGNYGQLAEHFLGMIRDDLHLQVVLGLRTPPTPGESHAAVESAVALFVRGVRHPAKAKAERTAK